MTECITPALTPVSKLMWYGWLRGDLSNSEFIQYIAANEGTQEAVRWVLCLFTSGVAA